MVPENKNKQHHGKKFHGRVIPGNIFLAGGALAAQTDIAENRDVFIPGQLAGAMRAHAAAYHDPAVGMGAPDPGIQKTAHGESQQGND